MGEGDPKQTFIYKYFNALWLKHNGAFPIMLNDPTASQHHACKLEHDKYGYRLVIKNKATSPKTFIGAKYEFIPHL